MKRYQSSIGSNAGRLNMSFTREIGQKAFFHSEGNISMKFKARYQIFLPEAGKLPEFRFFTYKPGNSYNENKLNNKFDITYEMFRVKTIAGRSWPW